MMKRIWAPLTLALLLLVVPRIAHAQARAATPTSPRACLAAAQVVTTGDPAEDEDAAWRALASCDGALRVTAYRAAMQRLRRTLDIDAAARAMRTLITLRDGQLFAQVMQTAGDPGATAHSRVMAFVALATVADPHAVASYLEFLGGVDERGESTGSCARHLDRPVRFTPGPTPLPPDSLRQIRALRDRVRMDPGEPADVRSAAACVVAPAERKGSF
jgi:hypothetical protein